MGAYGLTFPGPVAGLARSLLMPALKGWPEVEVHWAPPLPDASAAYFFGADEAVVPLVSGGHVVLDRVRRTARFCKVEGPDCHQIAHPCLSTVGRLFGRWDGRLPFHASAVIADGAAWGVLGSKEAGKSTTVACLADAGYGVLSDDVLVLDRRMALAGPRLIDLRLSAADHLGRDRLVSVRKGERFRLVLPAVAPEVPFAGFLVLSAGEDVAIERVALADRLEILRHYLTIRRWGVPGPVLLELVSMPMYRVQRSREWARLPLLVDRLSKTIAA